MPRTETAAPLAARLVRNSILGQKLGDGPKGRQGRAELVRDGGNKVRLKLCPLCIQRNQPLALELAGPVLASARVHYRHVNQAERWQSAVMDRKGPAYVAAIPGAYTDSPYPLQYYFELKSAPDRAWLYPGFPSDLAGQPYYVIRGAS